MRPGPNVLNPAISLVLLAAITLLLSMIPALAANAGDNQSPYSDPLRSSLGAFRFVSDTDDAAALFVNPAGLAFRDEGSLLLLAGYTRDRLSELTAGLSGKGIGLGYSRLDAGPLVSGTVRAGFAARLASGLWAGTSMAWCNSDAPEHGDPFVLDMGLLARPFRFLSIGGVWRNSNTPLFAGGRVEDDFTTGVSIRPLTERATLSAQGRFADGSGPSWIFGGAFRLAPGLEIFGSYTRDLSFPAEETLEEYSAGFSLVLGNSQASASTRSRAETPAEYSTNTLAIVSSGAFRRDALIRKGKLDEITVGGRYLDEGGGFQLMGGSSDLHAILADLESARRDPDIEGLLLKIEGLSGGFIGPVSANLCEIRQAVSDVRAAGKPVVAYIRDNAGAAQLYLASAADRIVVPEVAATGFIGVSLELRRMKRMFEKMGVEWDHATAGKYKSSFHVQYTDTSTTAQAEELQGLVDEAYRLLVDSIAEGRGIDRQKMLDLSEGQVFTSREAVDEGLIDMVGWEDDAREELARLAGLKGSHSPVPVSGRKYWSDRWAPAPSIAVVGAYGGIVTGTSGRNPLSGGRTMGSKTLVKTLRRASSSPGVKAIVLRVDSGGGSALASDEILGEIRRIQTEQKLPVVISMSNVAGSGGYWISMYGDAIYAEPFTITGSIGVVMVKPVMQLLYDRIGLTSETYKAGRYSDALSTGRHFTDEEMGILNRQIGGMYDIFLDHVAEGRKMDIEKVRSLAGGRVYFGSQALEAGLVDELGGLSDAVRRAAELAGTADDYRTVYFPAFPRSFLERLLFPRVGLE